MALFRGRLVQRVRRFPEEYHDFGWKYGDLHHYYNGSFFTQISNIDDEQMETNTWDVVGHSVGQCTYLVIKGQDLYEGDIIKYSQHKGYALVDIFQPCVVFNKQNTYQWFKQNTYYLNEEHDRSNRSKAFEIAFDMSKLALGVIYQEAGRKTYEQLIRDTDESLHQIRSGVSLKDFFMRNYR